MILKGNQRGGGQQLAAHLLNSFDNERVEVADTRGAVADDLSGAFAEWAAEARGTRCVKFLYSLSLNPDQSQGHLTREQYLELLDRTERSLKLVGQPRAVVFHEKRDKDGILREHCHAVWSRIDTDKMKAVQIAHDRLKLRRVAQQFARDHGLELPDGMKAGKSKDSRTGRFNNRAKQENLGEKQQQERTGIPKEVRMAELSACWHGTTNGSAFVHAMEDRGYYLARGDQRGYVVIDLFGGVYSLYRQIEGVRSPEIKARLSGYPLDKLPDVESTKAYARQKLLERQKAQEAMGAKETEGNQQAPSPADATIIEKKRAALQERQAARRSELDQQRAVLFARQFAARGALREMHAAEISDVAAARLEKQPKGLAAFLHRITGIGSLVAWAQTRRDQKRDGTHKQQIDALQRRHDSELKELDRHYRALDRLEARENRAAETALLREGYRKLRLRTFELKPEFQKAAKGQGDTGAADSGASRAAALFNRLAAGMSFTKGDLQRAFERVTGVRPKQGSDDPDRPPRPESKELERARELEAELERRQREQGREDRGPDRER